MDTFIFTRKKDSCFGYGACPRRFFSGFVQKSATLLKKANPNASMASWAIRWTASLPEVVCILSGMANMEQVIDNVQTMRNFSPVNTEEQKVIDKVLTVYLATNSIPCTGCLYCDKCPQIINIASIFAVYNDYLRRKNTETLKTAEACSVNF